jgi:hypothetical protein
MRAECAAGRTNSQHSPAPAWRAYTESMARGWESKEVESQIETAAAERGRKLPEHRLTPEEANRERERDHIEASKSRVCTELGNPNLHPRHRQMLEAALTELDRKLTTLTPSGLPPDPDA